MYRQTLRMSVLSGILRLQEYCSSNPGVELQAAVALLKNGTAMDACFDYATGLHVIQALELPLSHSVPPARALQDIIATTIMRYRPPWTTAIPYGRSQLLRLLSPDEAQCLSSAQLLDPNPSDHIVAWWDQLANFFRAANNVANTDTGRMGERLSLQYERARLTAAGRPDITPRWVSLDDNSLGYDIASFDANGETPRFIEVKTATSSPPRIFISRNEWRAATQMGARFLFHVWDIASARLAELSPTALSSHIPSDAGYGAWQQARIDFPVGYWTEHSRPASITLIDGQTS